MNGRVATILVVFSVLGACEGKSGSPRTNRDAVKAEAATKAAADEAAAAVPEAKAAKAAPEAEARPDPAWFRTDLVPDAKVVKKSRSQEGQSMFLLDFPAGATPDDCIAKLKEKIDPHVPLAPAPEQGKPGQLTLKGSTGEYRVTVVCGDARGTTRAYVGYQWGK